MAARWEEPRASLRVYQREALAAIDAAWSHGSRRALVVLPPGSGKTLVGLTAAVRLRRPIVILSPNTAIQVQWATQYRDYFAPEGPPVAMSRDLTAEVTSLTYQAVAAFDPEAEVDEAGDPDSHAHRLGTGAKQFFETLAALGEATLLLDECHHLLAVWGELLDEMLAPLTDVRIIGLTATPPAVLTSAENELTERLLGPPVFEASIPALVRQGYLAPYTELAWLTPPTSAEADWLAEDALRFAELRNDLAAPDFASTRFFEWLDLYCGRLDGTAWAALESTKPDLADALMHFHHDGLATRPPGSRGRERYRSVPSADDWARVIGEFVREVLRDSQDPKDVEALRRLREALPAVGFRLTSAGVQRGRSPVDRVIARSAAKSRAAVEILAAELASIPDRMRALVVVDHERATATLPANLTGVIAAEAGSAVQVAEQLSADTRIASRGIALVTGKTVAANSRGAAVIRAARPSVRHHNDGALIYFEDDWGPREWVPFLTGLFEDGGLSILVGTRALLGEGWDARSVTTLVDLTTATTATAVVQVRGRALRLDPAWPEKVAHTWSVVCVAGNHPRGNGDYERFVRKHSGYFAVNRDRDIVAGVGHVDSTLSPFHAPDSETFDSFNAKMLVRSEDRAAGRAAWRIGEAFADEVVPAVQVQVRPTDVQAASRSSAATGALELRVPHTPTTPIVVVAPSGLSQPVAQLPRIPAMIAALGAGMAVLAVVLGVLAGDGSWLALAIPAALTSLGAFTWGRAQADRAALSEYQRLEQPPPVSAYAEVVASALGQPQQVRFRVRDGVEMVDLPGPQAATFAAALDELLGAPGRCRYLIARPILPPLPAGRRAQVRLARQAARGDITTATACHCVPSVFAARAADLKPFTAAWTRLIANTTPVFATSPAGVELLNETDGSAPTDAITAMRVVWE